MTAKAYVNALAGNGAIESAARSFRRTYVIALLTGFDRAVRIYTDYNTMAQTRLKQAGFFCRYSG